VHTYDHCEKGATYASQALGIPLERFAKTIVVDASGEPVFVVISGDADVSLKSVARLRGVKHAALADPADAQRLTGYLVGGISPFGSRRALATLLDEQLVTHDNIAINAGQRGVIIELAAADVVTLLDATVADVRA
jgi:Cys-tRNA(Pro)/Cys-tRNA(Cys) deacylase